MTTTPIPSAGEVARAERETQCVVCAKMVLPEDQEEHLKSQHLGPHYFWFNMRPFRTDKPSMRCGDFIKYVGADPSKHIYEERGHEQIFYGHSDAIDLTRRPQLFTYQYATPYRNIL